MGWKAVKEHYGIEHIVHIKGDNLCIGSECISDIITMSVTDVVPYPATDFHSCSLVKRLSPLFSASKEKLKELIDSEDAFAQSLPVWTYGEGEIIEKKCEEYGWPNVTHDGLLMYEHEFFEHESEAIDAAISNMDSAIIRYQSHFDAAKKDLEKIKSGLRNSEKTLSRLIKLRGGGK